MSLLMQYGWNSFHTHNNIFSLKPGECYGRVVAIKGHKHTIISEHGELECELSGKLLFTSDAADLPKVGDWITFLDYGDTGIITSVLGRRNTLSRKRPGDSSEKQVLAANIDGVLIVQSLDNNFNLMRLERYIVQIIACGIDPIVVLNKVDLIDDPNEFMTKVATLRRDVPVVFCSTVVEHGLVQLRDTLKPLHTYILVGSSGVGKSSLINGLLETEVQSTGGISHSNNKGRHTTTTRELYPMPNGSLIIDTPGMREFGATFESDHSDGLFPAISALSRQCRFSDCLHLDEPGCAVLTALQQGKLSDEVYSSYIKLTKEQKRFQIRAEDKKRMNRQFGKMTREAKVHRKRNKF
jgi:ribosome biogenesis GTPase / thiamine phosphate phosphatase